MNAVDFKEYIIKTLEVGSEELKKDNRELKEMLRQLLENKNKKN